VEQIGQLPSKAPFSKRFEEIVGEACESAAVSQVGRRFQLPETTVRGIDLRYLERWDRSGRKPALRQMGVDEICRGKNDRFLTVVSNLETGEPLWFGKERKKETPDEFFRTELSRGQRKRLEAACVDMREPFRLSIEEWARCCSIVYDKFHIVQHANDAVEEVRRAEFFRKGPKMRDIVRGKRWLLLSRWKNLASTQRGVLNRLFQLKRRVFKAYLLRESLEQLRDYRCEGAMVNDLRKWMDPLRRQRLPPFQKLAGTLIKHINGILNYCRTKVRFGVVEAINGNIRMPINRGRGYKDMHYLLLKARRMAVTNTEYAAFQKIRKAA
jgi:transposase